MIPRDNYQNRIETAFKSLPIVVLIGARQVGKTSIMKMYPTDGFKNTLFLNGQDPDVAGLFEHFATIEQYLRNYLNPELDGILMIDEFQFINGIATMLKLITDKYAKLKVLCSGSSSLDIQQRIDESLAGRVRVIEVLSLSFAEFLLFKDEKMFQLQQSLHDYTNEVLTRNIQQVYQEYIIYGGLPRVALADNVEEKIELLNDIYQTYLLHDVRRYVANEHFVGFNRLLRLLATQIGNLVNVNDMSRESGLPYSDCETYINLLQQMYIIKLIEPYYTNRRKVIGKMKKVYFCDLGLRNIIYGSFNEMAFRTDKGSIFENEILLELWRKRRADEIINFYRTTNGTEVDFVVKGSQRSAAIECKYKHYEKPISISALSNLGKEEFIDKLYVANINCSCEYKNVNFVPCIIADRIL